MSKVSRKIQRGIRASIVRAKMSLAVVLLATLGACTVTGEDEPGETRVETGTEPNVVAIDGTNLQYSLRVLDQFGQASSTFLQNEPVFLVLTLSNSGSSPESLRFNSGLQSDFVVADTNDVSVWRWSSGRVFTQAFSTLTVPAQDSVVLSREWDQRDDDGQAVGIGDYMASGFFAGIEAPRSGVAITVQ